MEIIKKQKTTMRAFRQEFRQIFVKTLFKGQTENKKKYSEVDEGAHSEPASHLFPWQSAIQVICS